jgi:hypothetical protein
MTGRDARVRVLDAQGLISGTMTNVFLVIRPLREARA